MPVARSHISFQDVEPYDGAHGEDRTPDSRIKNPLLYQLSYMNIDRPRPECGEHSDLALPGLPGIRG